MHGRQTYKLRETPNPLVKRYLMAVNSHPELHLTGKIISLWMECPQAEKRVSYIKGNVKTTSEKLWSRKKDWKLLCSFMYNATVDKFAGLETGLTGCAANFEQVRYASHNKQGICYSRVKTKPWSVRSWAAKTGLGRRPLVSFAIRLSRSTRMGQPQQWVRLKTVSRCVCTFFNRINELRLGMRNVIWKIRWERKIYASRKERATTGDIS